MITDRKTHLLWEFLPNTFLSERVICHSSFIGHIFFTAFLLSTLSSCGEETSHLEKTPHIKPSASLFPKDIKKNLAIKQGDQLRSKYCVHCHDLPSPSILPRESWPEAMRSMNMLFVAPDRLPLISGQIPAGFKYDPKEFIKIGRYMMSASKSEKELMSTQDSAFLTIPDHLITKLPVPFRKGTIETLFKYSPDKKEFYLGVIGESGFSLNTYNTSLALIRKIRTREAPIDLHLTQDSTYIATMGNMEEDNRKSEVLLADTPNTSSTTTIAQGLSRGSDIVVEDFDGDSINDILHIGFGDNSGKGEITILWGKGDNNYSRQKLMSKSGGLKAHVVDINGDQRKDFLVLFAQNYQNLILFENQGNRKFTTRQIIDRPVGWGYMSFELIDMNGDQHKDIVTVVGNNMELISKPLKPYHGIYVWENNGKNEFVETSFHPFIGASQIQIGDFNGDRLMDFAATSLAPNWRSRNPITFGLWLQTSDGDYKSHTLSETRWARFGLMTMKPEENSDQLWLLSSNLPIGLPPTPTPKIQKSLASPPFLIQFDLKGYQAQEAP